MKTVPAAVGIGADTNPQTLNKKRAATIRDKLIGSGR